MLCHLAGRERRELWQHQHEMKDQLRHTQQQLNEATLERDWGSPDVPASQSSPDVPGLQASLGSVSCC